MPKDTEDFTIIYAPDPVELGKLVEIGRVDNEPLALVYLWCDYCGSALTPAMIECKQCSAPRSKRRSIALR